MFAAGADMVVPFSLQIRVFTGTFGMSARPRSGHDLPTYEPSSNGTKRLYRARDGRVVAGVCAGLATYFGVDPTLVRLAFALVTVFGGMGILLHPVAVASDAGRGGVRRFLVRDSRRAWRRVSGGQADRERRVDGLCHRAASQDAEALAA